jgi:hypothetical protein
MQGGKNWILPKRDKCKPVFLRLSLAGYLEKPLMSLIGTEWKERRVAMDSRYMLRNYDFSLRWKAARQRRWVRTRARACSLTSSTRC